MSFDDSADLSVGSDVDRPWARLAIRSALNISGDQGDLPCPVRLLAPQIGSTAVEATCRAKVGQYPAAFGFHFWVVMPTRATALLWNAYGHEPAALPGLRETRNGPLTRRFRRTMTVDDPRGVASVRS